MIKFKDSLGIERGIEFSHAYTEPGKPVKYINLTLWAAKNTNGSTVQMSVDVIDELIDNLTNLKEKKL